jgi:hypothetical protein
MWKRIMMVAADAIVDPAHFYFEHFGEFFHSYQVVQMDFALRHCSVAPANQLGQIGNAFFKKSGIFEFVPLNDAGPEAVDLSRLAGNLPAVTMRFFVPREEDALRTRSAAHN